MSRMLSRLTAVSVLALTLLFASAPVDSLSAQEKKPNILVIWGDDIGIWNISHNNRGMMGYETPNIDRIAKGGLGFTDYNAQQSCTLSSVAMFRCGPA